MTGYVLRRLLGLIPILFGISVLVFAVMRMLPGDVAMMILMGSDDTASNASPEVVAALREQLGLGKPYPVQYLEWIGGLLTLDAGTSLWSGRPVMDEIAERLPLTIELALLALLISLVIAIPVGIISAIRRDTWVDYLFRGVTIAGLAVPSFWLGTLTILFLTLWFNWAPPLGYRGLFENPVVNLQQLIWPALVMGYSNAALIARMTRSAMLEVLQEDYMRTARAKGLGSMTQQFVHALPNAILPVLTLAAIEFGHLLGGAVIMETIFTLPGIGRYLIDAIFRRDYPVVQTIVVFMGVLFVVMNLVVDLLYHVLDPRIRHG